MLADKFYLGEEEKKGSFKFQGDSGSRNRNLEWIFRDVPSNYAVDPTGWYMSEKLDGVRALWNGKEFISRGNKVFHAPDWFKDMMPKDCVLDGELHCGRGQFQFVSGVTRHKVPVDKDWEKVRFCVFDAPMVPGGFEERMKVYTEAVAEAAEAAAEAAGSGRSRRGEIGDWFGRLRGGRGGLSGKMTATKVRYIEAAKQIHIQDFEHAYELYKSWVSSGAEGAMLRAPGSPYEKKRSKYLLKWKPIHDEEAEVIGFQQGRNRLSGKLGTFIVKMGNKTFSLSGRLSDIFREQYVFKSGNVLVEGPDVDDPVYPSIGDIVTFTFMEYTTGGLPRQPIFQRIRYKKNQLHRA